MIHLKDVSKKFAKRVGTEQVLENISFTVEREELVAIVGKSGCGKSTILNIVSGIETVDSGVVRVAGSIAYATQKDMLLSWRTVLENVLLPLEIEGKVGQSATRRALALLHEVQLVAAASKFPHELSGGMRQRASFVRAVIQDADIVLFDEPFSAVDFGMRLKLARNVRNSIKGSDRRALFVTHNIEEALSIADRILVLGNQPTQVIGEFDVSLQEEQRSPVEIRKTSTFQSIFSDIWQLLETEKSGND